MPKNLLRSPDHSALAVVVWAYYETLTVPRIEGGVRGPRRVAQIRRGVIADVLGVSDKALDRARRELFNQDLPGGAWPSRSRPRGFQRSVLHSVLRLPGRTGEPYAKVPNWTLDLVHAGRGRRPGEVSPDAWRLYGLVILACDAAHPDQPLEASLAFLGSLLNASATTVRRRLGELEAAGLFEVTEQPGQRLLIVPILTPYEAAEAAARYAEHGRRHPADLCQIGRKAAVARLYAETHLADQGPLRGLDRPAEELDLFDDLAEGSVTLRTGRYPCPFDLHTRSTMTWRSAGVTPCSKPPSSFQRVADVGSGHLAEAADVVRRRAIPAIGDGLAAETNTMSYLVPSET